MKEMFVMLAKLMSKDQCVERLEDAIAEYKEAKLINGDMEKAEHSLFMSAHLLILNNLDKDPGDIIKEMHEVQRSVDFFKTDKN